MASILNTDLGDLYSQWGERVAFNEGFQAQKIAEAKNAGRDAFSLGVDRAQGRDMYFDAKEQRFSEVREFLAGEPAAQISDENISDSAAEVFPESELLPYGEFDDITDGEETLGMESVVVNETEDVRHYSEEELDAIGPVDDDYDIPHLDEYHEYLHSTRDVGADFVGFHEWHMGGFGDFGIR